MAIERIKTHVKGFDEELDGGIPRNHVALVTGSTGTMKSSFVYYILYNNALRGTKGFYVTLEQTAESLFDQMKSLGMNVGKVSASLPVFDLSRGRERLRDLGRKLHLAAGEKSNNPFRNEGGLGFLSIFQRKVEELKERYAFELVAIDSLEALELVADFRERRADLYEFFDWLRGLKVTSFLISEFSPNLISFLMSSETYDEAFLSDAVIEMKMETTNDVDVQRRIRCVKMRSTNHSSDYFTLVHAGQEFEVTRAIR